MNKKLNSKQPRIESGPCGPEGRRRKPLPPKGSRQRRKVDAGAETVQPDPIAPRKRQKKLTTELETLTPAGGGTEGQGAFFQEVMENNLGRPLPVLDSGEIAIAKKDLIPIMPANGLYLQPYAGDTNRNVVIPRFVRLFRKTWHRIPAEARQSLLRYWRKFANRPYVNPRPHSPIITLADDLQRPNFADMCERLCVLKERGIWLAFNSLEFAFWEEEELARRIAHALARALRCATGCAQVLYDAILAPVLRKPRAKDGIDIAPFEGQLHAAREQWLALEESAALFTLQYWGFEGVLTEILKVVAPLARRRR